MRDPRQLKLSIALCAVIAVIVLSIAGGGARDTRAADPAPTGTPGPEESTGPGETPPAPPEESTGPGETPPAPPDETAGPGGSPSAAPTPESTPGPPPVDGNLDGIADDLQQGGLPFGSFVDSTVPPTSGSIVSTSGMSISITDAADPSQGIMFVVGPGPDGAQVELSVCGGFTLLIDPSSSGGVTCGSVTVRMATGSADVVLGGGITIVSVPAGGAAKVAIAGQGTYSVANVGAAGSPAVALTVDGTTTAITYGATTQAGTTDFVGFSSPIDNIPVFNRVNSGQAIPVKWRLLSSTGAPVLTLTNATIFVTGLTCSTGATIDNIEEVVADASGLKNLGNGNYQINWKSPKTYAATCKTLHLDIGDGVTHDARFQFTK